MYDFPTFFVKINYISLVIISSPYYIKRMNTKKAHSPTKQISNENRNDTKNDTLARIQRKETMSF